jgi:hypothetical protein
VSTTLRFLIAPLKFVSGMLLWAIFLLLSPLLLIIALTVGIRFMSPEEGGLMKVFLVVVGPFAFVFWWLIISHFCRRYRAKRLIAVRSESGDDYTDEEFRFLEQLSKPRHFRNLGLLLISFAGSLYCSHILYSASNQQFFFGVLGGIFSPAIIAGAWRLMRRRNR